MNIELHQEGEKIIFNWNNVVTVSHPLTKNGSYVKNGNPHRTEKVGVYCVGDIIFYVDETYEKIKMLVDAMSLIKTKR